MEQTEPDPPIQGGPPPTGARAAGSPYRGELSFRGGANSSGRIGQLEKKAQSGGKASPTEKGPHGAGQLGRARRGYTSLGGVDPSGPAVGRQLNADVGRQRATVEGGQASRTGAIRSTPSTRSTSLLDRNPDEGVSSPPVVNERPPRRPGSVTVQSARDRTQKCPPTLGSFLCLGRRSTSPTPSPTRSSPSPALDPRYPSDRTSSQSLGQSSSDIFRLSPPRSERPGSTSIGDLAVPREGGQRNRSGAFQPSQTSSEIPSRPSYASPKDSTGGQQIVRAQLDRSVEVVLQDQGPTASGRTARAATAQAETAQAATSQAGTIQADTFRVRPSRNTAAPGGQISSATARAQKAASRPGSQAAAVPQSGGAGRSIHDAPSTGESPASGARTIAKRVNTRPVPYLPRFPEAPLVGETPEPYRSLTIRTSREKSPSSKKKKKASRAQHQAASIPSVGSQSSPRKERPFAAQSEAASVTSVGSQSSLRRERSFTASAGSRSFPGGEGFFTAQSEAVSITSTEPLPSLRRSSLRRERSSEPQSEASSYTSATSQSALRREQLCITQPEAASFAQFPSSTTSVTAAERLSSKQSKEASAIQSPRTSAGWDESSKVSRITGQGRSDDDDLRQTRVLDAVQATKAWTTPEKPSADRIQGSRTHGDGSSKGSDRPGRHSSLSTALRQSARSGQVAAETISVTERIRRQEEIIRAQQASGFTAIMGSPTSPITIPTRPSPGSSAAGNQRSSAHPVRSLTQYPARRLDF